MSPATGGEVSRKRYAVVAGIFVLSWILYIDRAAISSAKASIGAELGLSNQAMGAVFSAFVLGYALMQIPAGWLADRFGPRIVLAAMVGLWSLFTLLTGTASGLGWLLANRFLFGAAEAGAFPGSARTFHNWLPPAERGIAIGVLFSGAMIGGGVAYPVCAWLIGAFGWRWAFYLLAIPGICWALVWLLVFRDHPPKPLPREVSGPAKGPSFGQVFRSGPMALAMAQYFFQNFTFFIGMSWMLPYLTDRFHLSPGQAAGYSVAPLICGAMANFSAGLLVDFLYRTGRRSWSRRLPGVAGFVLGIAGVLMVPLAATPLAAVAGFAVAIFGVELTVSPSWAYCIDIGGKNSASVGGAMNMVGNLGAFLSANAFPFLHHLTGGAAAYFYVAAVLNLAGIACWLKMKPNRSVSA